MIALRSPAIAARSVHGLRGLSTASRVSTFAFLRPVPVGARAVSTTRASFIENTLTRADGGPGDIPHHGVDVDKVTRMDV